MAITFSINGNKLKILNHLVYFSVTTWLTQKFIEIKYVRNFSIIHGLNYKKKTDVMVHIRDQETMAACVTFSDLVSKIKS